MSIPFGLRAEYERDRDARLPNVPTSEVGERSVAALPDPVQRYLRAARVVGTPAVGNFRGRMHGRIRGGRNDRWLRFTAEQYNFIHPPARLFYFNASMHGVPVQGYHRYVDSSATMRVKAAGLVTVVRASGPEMTQSETVTLFNDMCLMAPGALIDPAIIWEHVDAHTSRARFTNSGYTISAELTFDDAGRLTNFVSDDRYQLSRDGKSTRRLRWSTPIADYRDVRGFHLLSEGEGRWRDADGEYPYIQLTIDDIEYNVHRAG
jgi:uncharacterized protein DUF6544